MAGDPDLLTTRAVVEALSDGGADAIELGVPYGDPLADGPTIAAAGMRALRNGVDLSSILSLVRDLAPSAPPIVLFTYFNPVLQYGIEQFARDAAGAGTAGVIAPDVTLEESEPLRLALGAHGIVMPLLVSPSTPLERASRIAEQSGGFVYVVSRLGVTGANASPDFYSLRKHLASLRSVTKKPLAVGFGIRSRSQIDAISDLADGAVVGSALIDAYAGKRAAEAANAALAFMTQLRG
jgi:tryptophan synthase alpha chain